MRVIPPNKEAMVAIHALYIRVAAVGGAEPVHYVFPACENGHVNRASAQKELAVCVAKLAEDGGHSWAALS
jgi:hypothetical protein